MIIVDDYAVGFSILSARLKILIECCINAANCFCVRLVVDGCQMLMSDVGSQACSGMCGWGIDVHHHLTFEVDKFV